MGGLRFASQSLVRPEHDSEPKESKRQSVPPVHISLSGKDKVKESSTQNLGDDVEYCPEFAENR